MRVKKNDGGSAFPVPDMPVGEMGSWKSSFMPTSDGMTLRDWFAGQALVGMCAAQSTRSWQKDAEQCYMAADAMLVERLKAGENDEFQC